MDFVEFYLGKAPDYKGRMIEDIWSWDHDKLEAMHDFIQVLFPLKERSQFVPRSPVLDDQTVGRFQENPGLRLNLLKSFDLMLDFYGLRRLDNPIRVEKGDHFAERSREWVVYGDHNHLRITRILQCLGLCSLHEHAKAFLDCLTQIKSENPREISDETVRYWKNAV